jgi:hypothetical protein
VRDDHPKKFSLAGENLLKSRDEVVVLVHMKLQIGMKNP